MIITEVYELLKEVSSAVRALLPKSSTSLPDLYCMMQQSLALGQLDQMMLFEDAASIQFPLRKPSIEENLSAVGPWPSS